MIVKFDSLNRFEVPQFTLCNPGSTCDNGVLTRAVGVLSSTNSEELVLNFNTMSELNLRVVRTKDEDAEMNSQLQMIYKSVQNRRMIFVEGVGYFIITEVVDGYDGETHYKDIKAVSCEKEISNKQLTHIEDGSYEFRKLLETIVGTIPLWTIKHIAESIETKVRSFEGVSENLNSLAFMLENMQDAYECIFVFDCILRTISVYDQNNYVQLTNIQISKEDVIKSLDITENSDDLYTALYVASDENVHINEVNPLGTGAIYDFSYYLSWMSDGLREKVKAWTALLEESESDIYELNLTRYNKLSEKNSKESDLKRLDSQIGMYNNCRKNIVAGNSTECVESYNGALAEKCPVCMGERKVNDVECTYCEGEGVIAETQISISKSIEETLAEIDEFLGKANADRNSINADISLLEADIQDLKADVDEIRNACGIKRFFTEDEYAELSNYIYEGIYTDDYIIITDSMDYNAQFEQMKTLYDRAKSQLRRVSWPTQEFSIDVQNFIFEKSFAEWSEQLETGVLINVELDDDIAALFLSNITVNYDDADLSLTFGNRFNRFDPKALFDDILGDVQKSSNSIDFIKDILYPIKNGEFNAFKEFIENSRTLTKNSVLASKNQCITIDDTGYTGAKINPETGEIDGHQIKINNNTIVFTNDGWNTCTTAVGLYIIGEDEHGNPITTYGINGETIMGNLLIGNQLKIYDDNNNELFSVIDGKISSNLKDINGNMSHLEQTVNNLKLEFDKEVDSVTTSTGYKFNSDGLTIYNSGSNIENKIDNTGMYVSRKNGDETEVVLSANDAGVNAVDITVKNYLVVGEHTRFEDYVTSDGEQKTAAFWI